MRFVTFNVNGIRARLHQLASVTEQLQPDVLALQEIKVADEQFPLEPVQALGYPHVSFYGQKGHYGVALLSKTAPLAEQLGFPWRPTDQQRRFQSVDYHFGDRPLRIINGYFPQGDSRTHPTKFPAKQQFYADIERYLTEHCDSDAQVILAGDMNVAPGDADVGIGEDNAKRWLRTGKASFLPEEREWLERLFAWGMVDGYAARPQEERLFSWFDYRSRAFEQEPKRGLRIDLILASKTLAPRLQGSDIDYRIRGEEKPSDHCPVWCDFLL